MAYSSPIVPDTKMNGVSGESSRASASAAMPSKPGIEKSERITSRANSRSACVNDASDSTMRWWRRMPARLSSRNSSSASALTSSVRSTRTVGAVFMGSCRRRAVGQHPVKADLRHRFEEGLELHRLDDVAVHAETVALEHVALLVRRGHHDYRDGLQRRALHAA